MDDMRIVRSKESDEWETPQDLFDRLDQEFHFTLDACADPENTKCERFYSKDNNALTADWSGETVFCNPPYSMVKEFAEKCFREGCKDRTTVVLLVFSRTDTRWFHDFIYQRAELRFLKGRVRFSGKDNAPFPSMIVIFRGAYA